MAAGRGGDGIKGWVSEWETGMGSSLRVRVRQRMISGSHQAAGTSQSPEPVGPEQGFCDFEMVLNVHTEGDRGRQ